jgi:hypothetical protein
VISQNDGGEKYQQIENKKKITPETPEKDQKILPG